MARFSAVATVVVVVVDVTDDAVVAIAADVVVVAAVDADLYATRTGPQSTEIAFVAPTGPFWRPRTAIRRSYSPPPS